MTGWEIFSSEFMGTLYIDRKDAHIRLDGNALAFYSSGDRQGIVPIKPLKRVVIMGNITIDASVLHRLADNDISVLFLSGKRGRFCGMLHGRLHNNGLLRVRQYEKCIEKGKDSGILFPVKFSMDVVLRKISAQADLLREAMNSRADLRLPLKTAVNILERVIDSIKNLPVSEGISDETRLTKDAENPHPHPFDFSQGRLNPLPEGEEITLPFKGRDRVGMG